MKSGEAEMSKDRATAEVYHHELVKANKALVRLHRKNQRLRHRIQVLESFKLTAILFEGFVKWLKKKKNKEHGNGSLQEAPPLS